MISCLFFVQKIPKLCLIFLKFSQKKMRAPQKNTRQTHDVVFLRWATFIFLRIRTCLYLSLKETNKNIGILEHCVKILNLKKQQKIILSRFFATNFDTLFLSRIFGNFCSKFFLLNYFFKKGVPYHFKAYEFRNWRSFEFL